MTQSHGANNGGGKTAEERNRGGLRSPVSFSNISKYGCFFFFLLIQIANKNGSGPVGTSIVENVVKVITIMTKKRKNMKKWCRPHISFKSVIIQTYYNER